MQMKIFSLLLAVVSFTAYVDYGGAEKTSLGITYWKTKLPGIPMPKPILESLPKPETAKGEHALPGAYDVNEVAYPEAAKEHMIDGETSGVSLFFLREQLLQKKSVTLDFVYHLDHCHNDESFPGNAPSFSTKNFPELLQHYSLTADSIQADIMTSTLSQCEHPNPLDGEHQFCATSLEEFANQLVSSLGQTTNNLRSIYPSRWPSYSLDTYKIVGFRQLVAGNTFLACHKLNFPYAVFRCHQPMASEVYTVSLASVKNDGVKAQLYAVCHTKTSHWNAKHPAFLLLNAKPGAHVCHFLQTSDMLWVRT